MPNFAIGVDLGGTNLRIAAVDEQGRLLEKVTLGTRVALGRERVISDMCEAIRHLSDKYQNRGTLLGTGIGVPGIIDIQTGMVRESPNLPGWSDSPVRAEIEKKLGTRVILENDANSAAFGEKWLGAARDVADMAMLTLGTGVGGGIVLGGRIWHGMNGMAGEFGSSLAFPCDVASDAEIEALFSELGKKWGMLDGVVHAIAFAPREAIAGDFLDGLSREAFRIAHDVSSYSFAALAKAALPLMQGRSGALVTLTYLGADRVVPGYNTMGLAKASLEASVRYLAASLGPRGIRVNAVSAGPIKTLAASGISGFSKILKYVEENSPLRRNVTTEDVGNVAAFLLSDLAAAVTGEILYADSGFNTVVGAIPGAGAPE